MQMEQSEFWPAQKRKPFSANVVHFFTPFRLEILCALRDGTPVGIAFGGQVAAQYYNFLRLGKEGYRKVHSACYDTARYLADEIAKLGPFEMRKELVEVPSQLDGSHRAEIVMQIRSPRPAAKWGQCSTVARNTRKHRRAKRRQAP